MTDTVGKPAKAPVWRRIAPQLGVGFLAGAAFGALTAVSDADDALERLPFVQGLTLTVAAGLGLAGLVLVGLSYRRGVLAKAVLDSTEGPATAGEAAFIRLSGWGLALSAALAAAPLLALLLDPAPSPRVSAWLLAGLGAGTALHAALNWLAWRRADELTRRASLEAAALAFIVFESGFFLWAAAGLLGRAPTVSAWTIWTVMFGLHLAAALWVSARRGLR